MSENPPGTSGPHEPDGPDGSAPEPRRPPAYGAYGPPGIPPAPPPVDAYATERWKGDGPLTVGQAYSYAWSKFRANAGTWIAVLVIVFAVDVVVELVLNPTLRAYLQGGSTDEISDRIAAIGGVGDSARSALASLVAFVVTAVLANGALVTTRKRRAELPDFVRLPNLGNVVGLAIVLGVASFLLSFAGVAGALVLLVAQFFLTFALYYALDTGQGAVGAIASSARLVARRPGIVILLVVAAIVVTVVGFVACLVGLFVAVPLSYLAYAFAYRRLTGGDPV
jgi:uncharacterized membrane protein